VKKEKKMPTAFHEVPDLLQAGEAEMIISTVTVGSRAPGQAKELILNRGLCAIDARRAAPLLDPSLVFTPG